MANNGYNASVLGGDVEMMDNNHTSGEIRGYIEVPNGVDVRISFEQTENGYRMNVDNAGQVQSIDLLNGESGAAGPQGPAGVGVPAGGITGQVLAKHSDADYDAEWVNQSGGGGDGTSDYNGLSNKPTINGITLAGAKTLADFGAVSATDVAESVDTALQAAKESGDFDGPKGDTGADGADGNGIASIAKTGTVGNVDTYTITFTNGSTTTFTVTNGVDGADGAAGADGVDGEDGNGIASLAKTGTAGNVDTYTITFTNGATSTFTVTNGSDGAAGSDGSDGADGVSPTVTVTDITGGHRVTITDANGSRAFDVMDGATGQKGEKGDPGEVTQAELDALETELKSEIQQKIDEPQTEGTSGQVLTTDGNGGRSWTTVQGGGGTSDYSALSNKPSINNVTLSGNKSLSDIGAASAADVADLSTRVNMLGTANFDLTTATDHYYISSDGTKNDSNNWSAIVIDDPTRFYKFDATLGSNSSTILGISFFADASLAKSSFISGVPIVTSGVSITANVPTNAVVAVVCTRTASYATPNATGYYAVSTVDANCNKALDALVNLEKYTPTQSVNVTFEQGSIASDTGAETSNANRIRSVGYIDVYNFAFAGCDYNHRIWFYEYDEFKRFVKGTVETRHSFKYAELDSRTRYIRIVLCNEKTSTVITPSDVTGFYCVKDIIGTTIVDYTASSGLIEKMGAYPSPLYTVPSATTGSDYTIVGTKFVKFNDGSDDLTTDSGSITYRKYDNGFDQSPTSGEKYINHYFGHCNSVDYNADNGCLILGNGSGSYNLPGKIFIIPDFDTILENAQNAVTTLTLQNTNAIVIDCTDYNLGSKFNVIWGEKNGTVSNVAYLITANFGKTTSSIDAGDVGVIRRLLLGMGSNQFTYGQFISGQSSDAFNGTFEILDTYTQDGTAYNDCCQGTCYYKGEIVCAIGHNTPILWRMNLADGKIKRKVYEQHIYAGDGSVASSGATGICTDGERVYTGVVGVGVWALNL